MGKDLFVVLYAISVPLLMIIAWCIHIAVNYKGTLKERLCEWYHESDEDY